MEFPFKDLCQKKNFLGGQTHFVRTYLKDNDPTAFDYCLVRMLSTPLRMCVLTRRYIPKG